MSKEQWKECSYCGITTDIDVKACPGQGLVDKPEHKLQTVELTEKEVKERCEKGKIWTKDVADLERRFGKEVWKGGYLNKKAYLNVAF